MKINLPSGLHVELFFKHPTTYKDKNGCEYLLTVRKKQKNGDTVTWKEEDVLMSFRHTEVHLVVNHNTSYSASVSCHSDDEYSKEYGRKLALKKLLNTLVFSKEDRKVLWQHTLPRRLRSR